MNLSINIGFFVEQYPFSLPGGRFNVYDLFNIIKRAGFSSIEIYPTIFAFSLDLTYLKNIIDKSGLDVYSAHLPMVGNNLSFDETVYQDRLHYLKNWIDCYAKLGVKASVIHPDEFSFDENEHPARMQLLINHAHELANYAKQYDMKIAFETTWPKGSLFAHKENIQYFKDNIKSDNLGFCFDTGHAYGSSAVDEKDVEQNFWDTFHIMKDKIFNFHLHNTDMHSDKHRLLSEGGIDFKAFFTEVKKENYPFPLTLEIDPQKALKTTDLEMNNLHEALSILVNEFKGYYD